MYEISNFFYINFITFICLQCQKEVIFEVFIKINLVALSLDFAVDICLRILTIVGVDESNGMLVSRKWDESLYHITEVFKYEKEAIERDRYYKLNNKDNEE